MKPAKKPKPTARERGYVERAEAARQLREHADFIETAQKDSTPLVKFYLQVWYSKDDEASQVDHRRRMTPDAED